MYLRHASHDRGLPEQLMDKEGAACLHGDDLVLLPQLRIGVANTLEVLFICLHEKLDLPCLACDLIQQIIASAFTCDYCL